MSTPDSAGTPTAGRALAESRPVPTLRAAVLLLGAQSAALVGIALWLVYAELTATEADDKLAWAVTGSAAIGAALFGLYAFGLARRWPLVRGLAVGTELIVLAPAYYMITGGLAWLGVVIAVICLATMGALIAPTTSRALGY
ncbi:hypothetical protein F4553_005177 [Allocatelliglobosispora scoriae]|uniref:Uncharacterized protein n=1 Tax=Allocatelliglobosispora scoriae TaxID=643052 RepID=A0A841BWE5_9ACTN|nr:hypothetical protein [Allocatelliglobosispora scoriae]MBB5871798.1 hypothetical protein [Allocatelliglobosispora scoriae]